MLYKEPYSNNLVSWVLLFCPFWFRAPLLKLNIRKKVTIIIKGLLTVYTIWTHGPSGFWGTRKKGTGELSRLGFGVPYFNTFLLKEPLWNKSLYFLLPGYLKAQLRRPFTLLTLKARSRALRSGWGNWPDFKVPQLTNIPYITFGILLLIPWGNWLRL